MSECVCCVCVQAHLSVFSVGIQMQCASVSGGVQTLEQDWIELIQLSANFCWAHLWLTVFCDPFNVSPKQWAHPVCLYRLLISGGLWVTDLATLLMFLFM